MVHVSEKENSLIPSDSAVQQTLESPEYARKHMFLVFKAHFFKTQVLPTWSSPGTPSQQQKNPLQKGRSSPQVPPLFPHKVIYGPMEHTTSMVPWEHTTFLGKHVSCVKEVDGELCARPSSLLSIGVAFGGERHACSSEKKTVAHITWPEQSHRGLLLGSEKLLF